MAWGGGGLTTTMAAQYGSHTFNETTDTTDLRITPVYDTAGRTVVYSVYSITLHETIADAAPTDAAVLAAIQTLTRPADTFVYTGRGMGGLSINTGKVRDVIWGPKPRLVGLKPSGAGRAVELTWQVEVAIPTCADAVYAFAPMEFNFKLTFQRDKQGYTTRTYSGFIRIPQTRANVSTLTLSDTADNYLEQIYPPLLPGFRRTPGTWTLSEDKCRGDFSITDEQMPPNMPPLGVIECQSNHTFHTTQSLAHWQATLSATYDLARNVNATFAVSAFLAMAKKRMLDAAKMKVGAGLPSVPGVLGPSAGKPVTIVPVAASASEPNIFGRTQVSLSLTYLVAGVGFTEVFANGGLWQPLGVGANASTWKDWVSSPGVPECMSARGHAKLTFRPNEDAIVDLCGKSTPATMTGHPTSIGFTGGAGLALIGALTNAFPIPAPSNSWLYYHCTAVVHPELGRVPVTTLPALPLATGAVTQGAWNVLDGALPNATGHPSPFPPTADLMSSHLSQTGGQTLVQQRSRPSLYVTIQGQALRAGYPIPMPELVAVNGARPTLVGRPYFAQGIVASTFVPIVRADWSFTYLFTDDGGSMTGSIPVPPNPFLA